MIDATKLGKGIEHPDLRGTQTKGQTIFRAFLHSGIPMRSQRFINEIETMLGCKVGHAKPGKPCKLKRSSVAVI